MLRRILTSLHLALCLLVAALTLPAHTIAAAWPLPDSPATTMGQPPAFDCAAVTEIPYSECEALVALYTSTDGANWSDNTGWLETATPCGWYGVTCAAGYVSQLNLDQNNLAGPLPSELGNLTALVRLRMLGNPISGIIPPTLGGLTDLEFLGLTGIDLSGSIPTELGNLTGLRLLYLSRTSLRGPIPLELGKLAALESLVLVDNQLSGPIPPELGNLITLEGLSLSENQLNGSIPPELGNLTKLRDLDLSYNQLSGPIPPELGNLTNIGYPWLTSQEVRGKSVLRRPFAGLDNSQRSHTTGSDLDPRSQQIGPLYPEPNSGYLDLSGNWLSGAIPVELGKLTQVAGVNLGCNQLTGTLPPEVGRVIRWGSVDYNLLTGYDPAAYPNWRWYLTQTVPPTNLHAVSDEGIVALTWAPIPYTTHSGFYEVSYATAPGGPFIVHGHTADKTVGSYIATGLTSNSSYSFRVRTYTPAHDSYWCNQRNDLWSDYSAAVSAGLPVRLWLPLVWR